MHSAALQDLLEIPVPDHPALVLDGCRRLLGPNLYGPEPGAVGDGLATGFDAGVLLEAWRRHARLLLDALGWTTTPIGSVVPAHQALVAGLILFAARSFSHFDDVGEPPPVDIENDPELQQIIDTVEGRKPSQRGRRRRGSGR